MELGKVGSGLDITGIVTALVDAEVAPRNNALTRRESDLRADLSALGSLKSRLADLDGSLAGLNTGSDFDLLSIGSPAEVGVVQTGSPTVGNYSIEISKLATSQVLASPAFASSATVVGTGTLTLEIGQPTYSSGASGAYSGFAADASKTVSISIDSSNNTLAGIRDAINASTAEITASLVVDGNQTRLLFTADNTGAATAMSISVDDDDGDDADGSNLSSLAYNVTAGFSNVSEARASQDASFKLNGLDLTNSSNVISGLVDGLDVTLKKVTTSAETIVVQKDTAGIEAKVEGFVNSYNSYQTTLTSLMDYTDAAGALAGDSTARRIQSSIRAATTGELSLSGNDYTMLSQVGISSDQYGKLSLDSSKFQAALNANADHVKRFFAGATVTANLSDNTDSTGLADGIRNILDTYINTSDGLLESREDRIDEALSDIADDRADILIRMTALEERYTKQFTAMDTLISQLQGTSNFLTNQMDAIKAAANR